MSGSVGIHRSERFVRIWPTGVSMLVVNDDRAWPWICAHAIASAQRMPTTEARDGFLVWAERMATHRRPFFRRGKGSITRTLQALVTVCDICGKRALYLQGDCGRCSAHRLVPEIARERRVARVDAHIAAVTRDIATVLGALDAHAENAARIKRLYKRKR